MRAYHHSRNSGYRTPYGAVTTGTEVSLSLDVWDVFDPVCTLRLWIDGEGETLLPMTAEPLDDRIRFTARICRNTPAILWYSFLIDHDGCREYYGAREGSRGGEGVQYAWEPPSFQITVYEKRPIPAWYKNGIVYQIFPDRFARDDNWHETLSAALSKKRNGPARRIVEDWDKLPVYEKDEAGRVTTWDFYGGTLKGIEKKLPYLKHLGVTALYLNPIFSAASNHRYDTADYLNIEETLGGNDAFTDLIAAAKKAGISVILDGVFNHTGRDSIYFDYFGNYGGTGAYKNPDSKYRSWYSFHENTEEYSSWWGVGDLPDVNENEVSYQRFIYDADDSVIRKWMRAGVKGFRLDVADELPDDFIAGIRSALLEEDPDGLLLGEVWEDASNKISYGKLRRYFLGNELDSVMNYPLRDALLDFLTWRISSQDAFEILESLRENYPPDALYGALNMMGSHDRVRLMNILSDAPDGNYMSEKDRCAYRLSPEQRGLAKARLWLITLIQMTMPGVPCIYYGDEVGMEGYADPANRGTFPWDNRDRDNTNIYRNAISLRKLMPVFTEGSFSMKDSGHPDVLMFRRSLKNETALVMVNRNGYEYRAVTFEREDGRMLEILADYTIFEDDSVCTLYLPPFGSAVVYFNTDEPKSKKLEKGTGVLCHITSVPNGDKPGNLGKCSRDFIDFLAEHGQKYWQILPVTPADLYGSPYAGNSAFAGNIDLCEASKEELCSDFSSFVPDDAFRTFCSENAFWLKPYSIYMALKETYNCIWQEFPERYRSFCPEMEIESEIAAKAEIYVYLQYRFECDWQKLHQYAKDRGVNIIGDIPMYLSPDSADVWAYPELFDLNPDGSIKSIAGAPPDNFCEEGQFWSNPVFDWEKMKEENYSWWIERLRRCFRLVDYVRLDHFRGFEAFWAIKEGKTAINGAWRYGPGCDLFERAFREFGQLPIIAEDLGNITSGVRALLARFGFFGMDIIQFYNGDPLFEYHPPKNKIVYTGTHDNQTLLGWCKDRYPGLDAEETAQKLMKIALECGSSIVIMPLQDLAGLDDDARMNKPATTGQNWKWKACSDDLTAAADRIDMLGFKL